MSDTDDTDDPATQRADRIEALLDRVGEDTSTKGPYGEDEEAEESC